MTVISSPSLRAYSTTVSKVYCEGASRGRGIVRGLRSFDTITNSIPYRPSRGTLPEGKGDLTPASFRGQRISLGVSGDGKTKARKAEEAIHGR